MRAKDWLPLIAWIALPLGAGALGSAITMPAIDGWYAGLVRPELSPPSWIFAPVWTTLFVLMGIGAYLVWKQGTSRVEVRLALLVFLLQLALNVLWSVIFFGLQSLGAAVIEIALLWTAIVATIGVFARVSKPAAWLLAPYILWVSFAAYLTYSIWMLNA